MRLITDERIFYQSWSSDYSSTASSTHSTRCRNFHRELRCSPLCFWYAIQSTVQLTYYHNQLKPNDFQTLNRILNLCLTSLMELNFDVWGFIKSHWRRWTWTKIVKQSVRVSAIISIGSKSPRQQFKVRLRRLEHWIRHKVFIQVSLVMN